MRKFCAGGDPWSLWLGFESLLGCQRVLGRFAAHGAARLARSTLGGGSSGWDVTRPEILSPGSRLVRR